MAYSEAMKRAIKYQKMQRNYVADIYVIRNKPVECKWKYFDFVLCQKYRDLVKLLIWIWLM